MGNPLESKHDELIKNNCHFFIIGVPDILHTDNGKEF